MTCATIFLCLSFKNEQLLQFRKFCFWFLNHKARNATDKNSSLNVNNRSLEFIDKNGSRVHLSQRLKRNFRFVKMCWELSDLTLFPLLDRPFVNFDRDLARDYRNVRECTTCKYASRAPHLKVSLESSQSKLKKFSGKHFACTKTQWMHKMSAVILWNSCFSRAGKRWLCINQNANNKK